MEFWNDGLKLWCVTKVHFCNPLAGQLVVFEGIILIEFIAVNCRIPFVLGT
jgi:hypothetical protein